MIFRWRLRAPQTVLSCHAACNRGSGRSRARAIGPISDALTLAPKPGSRVFATHRIQWPSRAGATYEPTTSAAFAVKFGRCSHTRTCEPRGQSCGCAGPPDILDVNIASAGGQQGPVQRQTFRWRFCRAAQNPFVGGFRYRSAALPGRGLSFSPSRPMVGIAMPPKADDPRWTPTSLAIDRVLPRRRQRTIRARLKSVQSHRRATTRITCFAIFPAQWLSYHPDLESRLTL